MPYARLDDRYDDHRKIKRALRCEPAAVAVHAMAITYCNRHNTDGEIDADTVEEWLSLMPYKSAQRKRVISTLLDRRLFERVTDDTFLVHDFLDWNLSSAQRKALAEQGRRGGHAKASGSSPPDGDGSSHRSSQGHSQGHSQGFSQGQSEGHSQGLSPGSSTPSPTPAPTPRRGENSTAELRSAVAECFAYWQERCHHPQATLTGDREGKLKARLRERARLGGGIRRAVCDVRKAIDGAARGAFVNEQGKRFDDLELICRSGSKLEDFMERAEPRVRAVPNRPYQRPNASEMLRAINGGAA